MNSIDTRIVQMQFENSQFERNIQDSLRSLEKLDSDLQGLEKKSGLDHLRDVGNSFNLNHVTASVDSLTQSFSALGSMGRRVIENITDGLYATSVSFAKDLSVNNITDGWGKFEEKTKAVQAIMNATGLSMGEVDEQLSMLQWYTDETSYSYSDMINNISKFTAMRVPLDVATKAMMGISNWAALSGQGTQQASVAMYNLSQAIGTGYLKLGDWKSIQNQMMGTPVFKETAIQVAKATGALDKFGKTAKGNVVNIETFDTTLADAWFNKDVLLGTLDKFSDYMVEVYKIHQETGESASDIMERLSDEGMELGAKASKAAQEYIVFSDTVKAVKDAVSTGWMETFELIIGDYEHATEVWSALGDALLEVFAGGVEARNGLLRAWNELGGREVLIQGVIDALDGLVGIVQLVKKAWSSVFPPKTAEDLMAISNSVAAFGKNLKDLYSIQQKLVGTKEIEITDPLEPIKELNRQLKRGTKGEDVKEMQELLMELDYSLDKFGADGIYGPETQAAVEAFKKDYGLAIDDVYDEVAHKTLWDAINKKRGPTTHIEYVDEYEEVLTDEAQGLVDGLTKIFGIVKGLFTGVSEESTKTLIPSLKEIIGMISGLVVSFLMTDGVAISLTNIVKGIVAGFSIFIKIVGFGIKVIGHLVEIFMPLIKLIVHIGGAIGNLIGRINDWLIKTKALDKAFEFIKNALKPIADVIENVSNAILDFFQLRPGNVVGYAISEINTVLNLVGLGASEAGKKILTFRQLWNKLISRLKSSEAIKRLSTSFQNLRNAIDKIIPKIKQIWGTVKENLGNSFVNLLEQIPDAIANVIDWFANFASKGIDLVTSLIDDLPGAIQKVKDFWGALTQEGDSASGKAPGFLIKVRDAFKSVIDFLFGEGDIANGKQAGIFRKLGRLLSGDLDAFTEGMDEDKKKEILDKIQSIKDFFQKIHEFLIVLFGGELDGDKKLSDETIAKIHSFQDSLSSVFEGISFLFTGKTKEDSKLSAESVASLQSIRDFFKQIRELFVVLLGGELDEDKKLSDETIVKIQEFRDSVISIFDSVGAFFTDVFNTIKGFITGETDDESVIIARETVLGIFNSIGSFFTSVFSTVKEFITGDTENEAIINARETVLGIFNSIGSFFTDVFNTIKGFVTGETDDETIINARETVLGIFDSIGSFFTSVFNTVKEFITGAVSSETFEKVKEIVTSIFNSIGSFFTSVFNTVKEFITGDTENEAIIIARETVLGIFNSIGSFFTSVFDTVKEFVTGVISIETFEKVKETVLGIFNSIGSFFTSIFNTVKEFITGDTENEAIINARETVLGIFDSIRSFFTSVFNTVKEFITGDTENEAIINARETVLGIFDSIGDFFVKIFNAVRGLITGKTDDKNILKFRDTVIKIVQAIGDTVSKIWEKIVTLFQNGINFDSLGEFFSGVWESIKGFVESVGGVISTNYKSTVEKASAFLSEFWKVIKKWSIIGIIAFFVIKIGKVIGKMTGVFGSVEKNTSSMSDMILKLAISFGIIALAIGLLGGILNKNQLDRGLAAFRWIAGVLAVFLLIGIGSGIASMITKTQDMANSFGSIGKYMLSIAASIGIIALAVWLVGSKLTPEQADAGVMTILKIAGIIAALSFVLKLISLIPGGSSSSFSGLWELAVLVAVMGVVVYGLSKMTDNELKRGVTAVLELMAIIAGFSFLLALANKLSGSGNVLAGIWQVALLIGVMGVAVYGLGKMTDTELTRGMTAVLELMAIIAGFALLLGAANRLSGSGNALNGLWQVSLLIGVMAIAVFGLSKMTEDDLNRGMTAILEIMAILAGFVLFVGIANRLSGSGEALKGLWQIALLVGVMAGAVYALSGLEDKVWTGVKAVAAIMVLIAILVGVMGTVGKNMKAGPMVAFFLGLSAVLIVFAIAISTLQDVPWEVIAAFSAGVVAISAAMALLLPLLSSMDLLPALKGCAILIAVFSALGVAVKIVLELVGSSLSSFSGALWLVSNDLKDFSENMKSLDESMATKFKNFMDAVASAFMNVTSVDFTQVQNFVTGLIKIGAGISLYTRMTSGLTDSSGNTLKQFATSVVEGCQKLNTINGIAESVKSALLAVGGAVNIFYGNLRGASVDENGKVDTAVVQGAFDAIADLDIDETAIANVAAYAEGDKESSLNNFAIGLANLSTAIGNYATEIGKLKPEEVTTANNALSKISSVATVQSSVGIFEGFTSLITGKKDSFTNFIADVEALGSALGSYGSNIGTLSLSQVLLANLVLNTLSGLDLQKTGGLISFITGDNNLDKFAANIKHVGDGIAAYGKSISGVEFDKTKIENSLIPITVLSDAQSKLNKSGGLLGLLTGEQNISTVGQNLVDFGKKVVEYSDIVKDFDKKNIEDAMSTLERSVDVQERYMQADASSYEWAISSMADDVYTAFTKLSDLSKDKNAVENTKSMITKMIAYLDLMSEETTSLEQYDPNVYLGKVQTLLDGLEEAANNIDSVMTVRYSEVGNTLGQSLSSGVATADVSGGSDVAKNMLDVVNDYKDDFNTAGRNFALGLANGVAFRAYSAVRAAETVAIQMINATRRIFNERSPSKVAQQIGSYFTEGLAIGTADKASEATNAASEVANSMLATASGTLSNLSSLLAEDIDVNPVIAPVVDLTNARQSAALIGGLFGNPSMAVTSSVLASNAMRSTNNGRPITIQNGTMSTSESFDGVTDKLNSLAEYLTARNDGPKLDEMTYLSEKFGDLAEAVTNLKIVLDTGTLVGELTPALDTGFGTLASRRDRGN